MNPLASLVSMEDFSDVSAALDAVAGDEWGDRPRGAPAPLLYEEVLLSQWPRPDRLACIIDALRTTLGLRMMYLGRVCSVWREAVRRRRDAWSVLKLVDRAHEGTL